MNFFLDFEATRFSNKIISIGCAADNGATFSSLVRPVNKAKVDNFITELTGITNEMLENAPEADVAFNELFDFIELNSDGKPPVYYCYGNSDVDFLSSTIKFMSDPRACICAQAIKGNIIDYATTVKKFFVVKHDLALRKVYMLIKSKEELEQKHDALEDALMLQEVVSNLYNKCKPEDKETIMALPSQKKPKSGKGAPDIFVSWNNQSKWEAKTECDENNWVFRCTDVLNGGQKYFKDITTAALWVIKYIVNNKSPKKIDDVQSVAKNILNSYNNRKNRYGCTWEYNPENAIAASKIEEVKE